MEDGLVGGDERLRGAEWLAGAGVAGEPGMRPAGDLEPDAVAREEAVRGGPQVEGDAQGAVGFGRGLAGSEAQQPSQMFTDLPEGSMSHSRAKKSVCGRLERTKSSACTGPMISRSFSRGTLVYVRTSGLASNSRLSRGPASRVSSAPPRDGVGFAGSYR